MTTATANQKPTAEALVARWLRFGIRAKLFLAFASVASLTLVAAGVTFLSYGHLDAGMARINDEVMPLIDYTLTLAREAGDLSTISSSLPTVESDEELTRVVGELQIKRQEIATTLLEIDRVAATRGETLQLKTVVRDLESNSDTLAELIERRLELAEERRQLTERAQVAHQRVVEKLASLIDNARFNLSIGLETLSVNRDLKVVGSALSNLLHSEVPSLRSTSDLRAESNLLLGLLQQGSLTLSADLLPPLYDSFVASRHRTRLALQGIGRVKDTQDLRQALESLLILGEGDDGVFSLRKQELSALEYGARMTQDVRSIALQLSQAADHLVARARANSDEALQDSRDEIERSRLALIGLAISSLLIAIAIGWIYVDKRLLRRMENLNETILALANGNLSVEIAHGGHDELSDVAAAVEVFKRNAIRSRELEADRERNRIEDLKRREASFRLLFESNPVPMWVHDLASGKILAVNESALSHYGYRREKFLAMTVSELISASERDDARTTIDKSGVQRHQRADGAVIDVAIYESSLKYEDHMASLVAAIDLTERRRAEQRIMYLAQHDALTDLPNRAAFTEHLAATLQTASSSAQPFAVICADVDHFKEVNDIFGHSVGDKLLQEISRRLTAAADGAFVARLGGDEFTVVMNDSNQPVAAEAFAQRLIAVANDELEIDGVRLHSGMSLGVAIYPHDGQDQTSLVANADAALYRAKADGRGGVRFFEPDMDARIRERHALQHELRAGIERNELTLYYQPQANVAGEIFGFEALVRWNHPTRGLVPPAEFISIAEDCGLIVNLGEWVLREACREAASWPKPLCIAVNLSPVQFRRGDLPQLVHATLLETGLSPTRLELEITEGVLMQDSSRSLSILRRLKALGVKIAMDDFGTGYSSLSYLQSFPFDKLKIDRSFISQVERQEQSAAIVRAVIGLGRSLDKIIIAEGVESQEQLDFLAREGCDEIQGFLIGRPVPISDHSMTIGRTVGAARKFTAA